LFVKTLFVWIREYEPHDSTSNLRVTIGRARNLMHKPDKPKIEELGEELGEELSFWNNFREARRAKGIDIAQVYAEWAASVEKGLASSGAVPRQNACSPKNQ
jgi:hypothetical protein